MTANLQQQTLLCPLKLGKRRLRRGWEALKGAMSGQKALQRSKTDTWWLLAWTKEKMFFLVLNPPWKLRSSFKQKNQKTNLEQRKLPTEKTSWWPDLLANFRLRRRGSHRASFSDSLAGFFFYRSLGLERGFIRILLDWPSLPGGWCFGVFRFS